MTDINTKYITLVGTPLSQSFAARMQNAAYASAGINMHYFYTEADSGHLGEIIDGIRHMPSFAGAAITKPNKVTVLRYLDELDPLCEMLGACNTVVKLPDGRLRGYNTDAIGFLKTMKYDGGTDIEGKKFFCIGAGGAGRAICWALAMNGAEKIYISSRTDTTRDGLVNSVDARFPGKAEAASAGDRETIGECDVIINASGVGMGESIGQSPVEKDLIPPGKLCFDACYMPEKTQFLLDSEDRGCRILNGLGMSLWQGVSQIELWQEKKAPVEAMRRELNEILKERR